ncbi:MAG: NUDIX domain-containing protein [Spirochaetales bacterium]|nr:NUDIX domain-containing protein [Spirochaetales bacterium]
MDELIDLYNENNEPLNIQKMKSEAHRSGLWHRSSHIWIFNNKSEILLQLRSGEKNIFPNLWDVSAAGHIGAGEKPINSAIRETEEEIGLTAAPKDLEFYTIRKQISQYKQFLDNEFHYVYFLKFNGDISNLILQKEEVEEIRFYHTDLLKTELNKNPGNFVPHGKYWLNIIKEVEKRINKYASN